jgi:hypothetical protein
MPFDVGESINYFADAFLRAPIVNSIAQNPIYTALVITCIIVLIIMFIFRDADTDDPILVMCLRSGFWIFLMLTGVLLLHNKVLTQEMITAEKTAAFEGVFDSGYPGMADNIVPVTIPEAMR